MHKASRQGACSLRLWLLLIVGGSVTLTVAAQNAQHTAPTNSQDAQTIDQTW